MNSVWILYPFSFFLYDNLQCMLTLCIVLKALTGKQLMSNVRLIIRCGGVRRLRIKLASF